MRCISITLCLLVLGSNLVASELTEAPEERKAIVGLIKLTNDENSEVRKSAFGALLNLSHIAPNLLDTSIRLLGDPDDREIQRMALESVKTCAPDPETLTSVLVDNIDRLPPNLRETARQQVLQVGDSAIPKLKESLENESTSVASKIEILHILYEFGVAAKPCSGSIAKLLGDEQLRVYALETLSNVGPAAKTEIQSVTDTLNDEDALVRQVAAKCVGKILAVPKETTQDFDADRYLGIADSLIRRFDRNNDGVLDETESNNIRVAGNTVDQNGDKQLDQKEIAKMLSRQRSSRGGASSTRRRSRNSSSVFLNRPR